MRENISGLTTVSVKPAGWAAMIRSIYFHYRAIRPPVLYFVMRHAPNNNVVYQLISGFHFIVLYFIPRRAAMRGRFK